MSRKLEAYFLHCRSCDYEFELLDSIEAEAGTLAAEGHFFCPRCGEVNDLPKEAA